MDPKTIDTQGMSADEIALLNDLDTNGDPNEDEDEAAAAPAPAAQSKGGVAQGDGEGDGTDPAEGAAAAAPAPSHAAAPAPAQAAAAGNGEVHEPASAPAPFVPQYSAEVPADAAEQIKTLKGEERDAYRKLMDGDIDFDAYDAVRERTGTSIDDLKTKALTASIFQQANEQAAMQAAQTEWSRSQDKAFTAAKAEGLDYKGKPALMAAFNVNLKTLGNDKVNEDKDADWFLSEAHKLTKADLGFVAKSPSPAPAPAPRAGVDLSKVPPTLANVPPAADPSISGDEFAHLSNLNGSALEREVAKMTPEQQERWLN